MIGLILAAALASTSTAATSSEKCSETWHSASSGNWTLYPVACSKDPAPVKAKRKPTRTILKRVSATHGGEELRLTAGSPAVFTASGPVIHGALTSTQPLVSMGEDGLRDPRAFCAGVWATYALTTHSQRPEPGPYAGSLRLVVSEGDVDCHPDGTAEFRPAAPPVTP